MSKKHFTEKALSKKDQRAAKLIAHYATCERLAKYLGMEKPDGKKISVALFKLERKAHANTERACNDSSYGQTEQMLDRERVYDEVRRALTAIPPGFFVNGDPRGYALKIDNETSKGKALIEAVKLYTDWGGYGILSPDIN